MLTRVTITFIGEPLIWGRVVATVPIFANIAVEGVPVCARRFLNTNTNSSFSLYDSKRPNTKFGAPTFQLHPALNLGCRLCTLCGLNSLCSRKLPFHLAFTPHKRDNKPAITLSTPLVWESFRSLSIPSHYIDAIVSLPSHYQHLSLGKSSRSAFHPIFTLHTHGAAPQRSRKTLHTCFTTPSRSGVNRAPIELLGKEPEGAKVPVVGISTKVNT
ncbi:uncharacterized protein PgNI_02643 [Pyricularia grisea]|uniref:Uncharacterized protein n=1 Tax=Pyricularia grisea TaxID=148305 RepID=A0A6P8BAW1_PYRGI|nr:uncharacterized protein PgNI_02643 [Pyricularia grisea]TLD12970.1 hypothetical protein PgNI_02643 [Pyricularia grisea]